VIKTSQNAGQECGGGIVHRDVAALQEKYERMKRKLYMRFVDLEKEFDRIP
jgi:hypothetical protein